VPGGRELAHIQAALGDQYLGGAERHSGDRAQQLADPGVGGEHLLDLPVQRGDRFIERVDVREQVRHDDPVVLELEAALERLA
jgi:hypothetical protein